MCRWEMSVPDGSMKSMARGWDAGLAGTLGGGTGGECRGQKET